MTPELRIWNRQRTYRLNIPGIERALRKALPLCLRQPGSQPALLPSLPAVEIVFVGNRIMSRIHWEFLKIKGPTDVITFPYGEIFVGTSIAQNNAEQYGLSLHEELLLYSIHGLLHLNGYDDILEQDSQLMAKRQNKILHSVKKFCR